MEVLNTVENKLLNRKEITSRLNEDELSLKRYDVRAQLAKKIKVDEKLVMVQKISRSYGSRSADVLAYVYDDEATLRKLTPEHLVKRNAAPAVEKEGEE
ncbi:MAG: hypothetical protein ACOCXG_02925 [Nanoarchaeota archaeon]